jgi:hypothetical protein
MKDWPAMRRRDERRNWTSSKGQAKMSETFVLAGEGKRPKKVEATRAQDAAMVGYASQLNPMFQTEFSEGGSDSQIFFDDSSNDGARSPVLESDREPSGGTAAWGAIAFHGFGTVGIRESGCSVRPTR